MFELLAVAAFSNYGPGGSNDVIMAGLSIAFRARMEKARSSVAQSKHSSILLGLSAEKNAAHITIKYSEHAEFKRAGFSAEGREREDIRQSLPRPGR